MTALLICHDRQLNGVPVRATYDREIIAEAARHFSLRSIRWDGFVVFLVLVGLLGYWIASGDRSWWVGALGAITVLGAVVGIATFVVPYRRSVARFERMPSRTGEFVFSERGIVTIADLGRQEFSWRLVDRVWIYPHLWMILLRDANYMTLPTPNLNEETRAFITDQVKRNGGRIG